MELRPLGTTDIQVTPIALGCWPLAGMSTVGVSEADAVETLAASFAAGINFVDTAYNYGRNGESERRVAQAIRGRRDQIVIATKGGLAWDDAGKQQHDARPESLRRMCEESLRRLETDRVELLYLHAPDPNVPLAESAGALRDLLAAGKTRAVGVSNVSLAQLQEFAAHCPLAAYQPAYNLLQREIEADRLPWCREQQVSVMVYWPLLKGLLAGKLARNHVFPPGDGRPKYPMFQGAEWEKNQDFVDELRAIAADCGHSVAQVTLNWTIRQPGVTAALCGAKRPDQIVDSAGGAGWQLSPAQLARIDAALVRRGTPVMKLPV
ncbi:MAG TPA: aldo/keto reductase [Pirellulales bacterium]|jgi:aryl-alcohol dehydrogenase-like predicted oxidoreductase|nr:aldo/keto reductase [Pirellulales bacterium]